MIRSMGQPRNRRNYLHEDFAANTLAIFVVKDLIGKQSKFAYYQKRCIEVKRDDLRILQGF
jgi:hypothetical protein